MVKVTPRTETAYAIGCNLKIGNRGVAAIEVEHNLAADPVAGVLLQAYGLGDDIDLDAARVSVQAALAEVRPYLHSHGGDMEVVHIEDGVVRLKLHGSCDGCTASDATIIEQVEAAMKEHWVDFRRIEVEEMTAEPHPPPVAGSITTGLQITSRTKPESSDD